MIGVRTSEGVSMSRTTLGKDERALGRRPSGPRRVVASAGSLLILVVLATIMVSDVGLSSALVLAAVGLVGAVGAVLVSGYLSVLEDWEADRATTALERLAAERTHLRDNFRQALVLAKGQRPQDIDSAAELLADAVTSMVAKVEAPGEPATEEGRAHPRHKHRIAAGA